MIMPQLSRRNFLKLASLLSVSALAPLRFTQQTNHPNIIIVVFDAWSYSNIGMFGYPRQTMPLLEKLAEHAIVYHNHYAGGPWTVPGTASLLTGTYPWTHRVFSAQQLRLRNRQRSIFALLKAAGYSIAGTSHNMYADDLLSQLNQYLDFHPPFTEMLLPAHFPFTYLFDKDLEKSGIAQIRAFWNKANANSSIFFSHYLNKAIQTDLERINEQYGDQFPRGVPAIPVLDFNFLLEDGIDHLLRTTAVLPQPQLSYYHYYPPHQPYRTRTEFFNKFRNDGIDFPDKPDSIINEGHTRQEMNRARQAYDETLLYVDAEFHRLYTSLKASGQLENTWLILTSDHGELFERGNIGHETPMGYDPEVRIPLFIFPPGQKSRGDITARTSAVDLLPTLLEIAGQPVPDWAEGLVLPPFGSAIPGDRSVFVYYPGFSRSRQPMSEGSATIVKGKMKLNYSFGMAKLGDQDPYIELFDLKSDPEEMDNLYTPQHPVGQRLLTELLSRMEEADQPYQ